MDSSAFPQEILRQTEQAAQRAAPPPPRAADLLARVRPWWKTWPDAFRRAITTLDAAAPRYAYAAEGDSPRGGYAVPAVIQRTNVETAALVDVTFFQLRGNRLRLRFQINSDVLASDAGLAVSFVAPDAPAVLFDVRAQAAAGGEFRIEADLPDVFVAPWRNLRAADPMPFRLILRPLDTNAPSS